MMVPYTLLQEAETRISSHIHKTPLTYDSNQDFYIKWENHQINGSFKIRGAFNKVLSLQPKEQERGLVAASAGNHGQGVALAGKVVGVPVTVFASENATPTKIHAMRDLGATVHLVPGGYAEAEKAGKRYAAAHDAAWISPYNDEQVIAGQGTLGIETLKELPYLSSCVWIVPVGGGGLISGIGIAIKSTTSYKQNLETAQLIGVQSQASPFFHAIYHLGTQEDTVELPSLADGLSGPLEAHSLTIPLVLNYVDDLILVSEREIAQAVAYAWEVYGERIEGSAATPLAAVISGKISNRPAVIIISGGNIQPEVHAEIIQHYGHHP